MTAVIEIPVWLALVVAIAAGVAVLDRVLAPTFRWYVRRRFLRAVDDLNKRLSLRIQPFKLLSRQLLVDRLSHDPEVMQAVEAHVAETGMHRDLVHDQVRRYAKEIAPSFSAFMYFGVGARVSRWIGRWLYRVRLGAFDRKALAGVDRSATIVFVMNHRSNVDYLLVTYLASRSSALSYAVGEWARVWPLSRIIRSMGAYFVRRRSRDALYRSVLRRYVRMATDGGVTQAIFPEGGLSRDGKLAPPKLGLLSYIVDGFDPAGERDVIFVPVGLNYDRVLEDRLLIAAADTRTKTPEARPRFNVRPLSVFRHAAGYALARFFGRAHKFGYACVSFGRPLSLRGFLGGGFLGGAGLAAEVERLGAELARRVGEVIPVLPVSLVAAELCEATGPVTRADLAARAAGRAGRLAAAGAHLHIPRDDLGYGIEFGLGMLTLRRIVIEAEGGLAIAPGQAEIVAYYANAIAHLGRGGAEEAPAPPLTAS